MKNIAIIGGSGFIGTRLIEELGKETRYTVGNFDKQTSEKYPALTTILNVTNESEIEKQLRPCDCVVLLAAEHRDDVSPVKLYYDVNVQGTKNVLGAMDKNGINTIIFTSSVAVYGLNKPCPDENSEIDPFNHYGKSKFEGEEALREWYNKDTAKRTLIILRPTVVFGPNNKGNVYNLLKQIVNGNFLMIGKGENKKSMSFINNIAGFIKFVVDNNYSGYHLYNYADKPDLTTNELLKAVEESLQKKLPSVRIPYPIGYTAGVAFDIMAKITGKKFAISSVRVKKFCSTTEFSSAKLLSTGYKPSLSLQEGINITVKSIVEANKTH